MQTGIAGLVVVLLVAALVWWFASDNDAANPAVPAITPDFVDEGIDRTGAQTPVMIDPDGALDDLMIEDSADTPVTTEAPAPVVVTPEAASISAKQDFARSVSTDGLPPLKAGVNIDRVRDGETQYLTVTAGGQDDLEFTFSDECWVQVKDGEGDVVYRDLNRAGDVMTVYGIAPFEVLLGKAPAVIMLFRGEPVSLGKLMTRDQTAIVKTARL